MLSARFNGYSIDYGTTLIVAGVRRSLYPKGHFEGRLRSGVPDVRWLSSATVRALASLPRRAGPGAVPALLHVRRHGPLYMYDLRSGPPTVKGPGQFVHDPSATCLYM